MTVVKQHAQKLYAYYKDLPPWAKGVIIVGSAAVVVYTTHAIVKGINDRKKKMDAQAQLVQYVKDLNDLIKQGVNPTYQESQYNIWADKIESQFAGCDPSLPTCPGGITGIGGSLSYSDSGYVVKNIVLQLKNDADFLCLQAAFKTRTYDACGIWTGNVGPVTLSGAIVDELNECEVKGLNDLLASQQITYKF